MSEQISKAEELYNKTKANTKRAYRNLRYSFYTHNICIFFVVIIYANKIHVPFGFVLALTLIGSYIAYLIFLQTLSGAANKIAVQWVGLTILFNYVGFIASYYMMKRIAIEQGWDK